MEELYHSYEGSALLGGAKKKHHLKLNMKKHAHHAHHPHHVTKAHVKRSYVPKKAHSSLLRYERLKASVGLSPIQEKRYRELKHAHGGALLGGEMLGGEMLGGAKLIGLAHHHAGALLGGDGGALLGGKKGKRLAPIKLRYRKFPSPKEYKAKYARKSRAVKPASPAQRAARARFSEATALVSSGVTRAEAFHRVFGTSRRAPTKHARSSVAHVGDEEFVINPMTNRRVSIGSPTYRRLVKEGAVSASEAQMLRTHHSEIARNARRPAHHATYSIEKQREALRPRFESLVLPEVMEAVPLEEYPPPYTEFMAAGLHKRHHKKRHHDKKHHHMC